MKLRSRFATLSGVLCLALAPPAVGQGRTPGAVTTDSVTYRNREVILAASLLLPAGTARAPGVVLVHGSGASSRSNPWTAAYAAALVERGAVVLHPDKRGSGQSGGTWRDATFSMLADDVVAAVEVLRAHPRVDSTRIGVIGFSQGGHIVPLVAARSAAVSLVVNVSGSVVPIMEQIGDELRKAGEREGLSAAQLDTLLAVHSAAVRFALSGEDWTTYSQLRERAMAGSLGRSEAASGFPIQRDEPAWNFLRTLGDFDPLPLWRTMKVPALFLYGGKDERVDVYKSARIIQSTLAPAGLPFSLLLFRDNGHALFRDDAMDFMARWIRDGGKH